MNGYVELQTSSAFSFLSSGSTPEELVEQAFHYDLDALAITDKNTLSGVPRAYFAARDNNMRVIVGTRLELQDGPSLLAYPTDLAAYSRLSNLLTLGNLRTEKGECHLWRKDVFAHAQGIKFILIPPRELNDLFDFDDRFKSDVKNYKRHLGRDLYLAATHYYQGDDAKRLHRLSRLASINGIPLVATNDVVYHDKRRRELQDIALCARETKAIHQAGFLLNANAERHLKTSDEMVRLFKDYPDAIANTRRIANACRFRLEELKYIYPEELTSEGRTPFEELAYQTWKGAEEFYGSIPDKLRTILDKELAFIKEVDYAPYFLTVFDIVRHAKSKGILCQGRGSAANSAVCFCLGITPVDPMKTRLLFERFISAARSEPPDIDVDFEHERREEVMQYVFSKYGRDRAAIIATVTKQMQKAAIRDVGRGMGLSFDTVGRISATIWEYSEEFFEEQRLRQNGIDTNDQVIRKAINLSHQMLGMPRQLGQHTGGFVITNGKLADLVPIMNARMENRTCIEWDKDDIDNLGFMKVDLLSLGMLTATRKTFDLVKEAYGEVLTLATLPHEDTATYDMICMADTVGVFQIESRAQMASLPKTRPRTLEALKNNVALIRPGPIDSDIVHPYTQRAGSGTRINYPTDEIKDILERTHGVVLFQEQVMDIAINIGGFSGAEADRLRRSMGKEKFKGMVAQFRETLSARMLENGYEEEYISDLFDQIEGFGSYGFPESHAASFAVIVYATAYLKCHYPDAFSCALLNSQPMGFYQPAQLIKDAQNHGVVFRPVDVNHSQWDNTLEEKVGKYHAIRCGLRQVDGLREDDVAALIAGRNDGYADIASIWYAGVSKAGLETLAEGDAFASLGLDRRRALWDVRALSDRPALIFRNLRCEGMEEPAVILPTMTDAEQVLYDYATMNRSLRGHPVSFVRDKLAAMGVIDNACLEHVKSGHTVKIAGLVIIRQRPGTAGGVCFMTLEEENKFANIVVFKSLFDKFRREIHGARLLLAEGKVETDQNVTHIIVKKLTDITHVLDTLIPYGDDLPLLRDVLSPEHVREQAKRDCKNDSSRKRIGDAVIRKARNFR